MKRRVRWFGTLALPYTTAQCTATSCLTAVRELGVSIWTTVDRVKGRWRPILDSGLEDCQDYTLAISVKKVSSSKTEGPSLQEGRPFLSRGRVLVRAFLF